MRKLLLYILPVMLLLAATTVYAQAKHKSIKHHSNYTIGFQSGREFLFNSSPAIRTHQSKIHTGVSSSLVLRRPIGNHLAVAAGVNYYPSNTAVKKLSDKSFATQPYKFALPVTVEYYFLPRERKLRPFVGAGAQYNLLGTAGNTSISPFTDNSSTSQTNSVAGTKYINILFTQGVTFEINTRIQLTESIHFIPDNNNCSFGIDLGIGFRL